VEGGDLSVSNSWFWTATVTHYCEDVSFFIRKRWNLQSVNLSWCRIFVSPFPGFAVQQMVKYEWNFSSHCALNAPKTCTEQPVTANHHLESDRNLNYTGAISIGTFFQWSTACDHPEQSWFQPLQLLTSCSSRNTLSGWKPSSLFILDTLPKTRGR